MICNDKHIICNDRFIQQMVYIYMVNLHIDLACCGDPPLVALLIAQAAW